MNDSLLEHLGLNKDISLDMFSRGFKNFLERKNYNTRDIAKILGVTDSSVSAWKYARAFPELPNLYRLFVLGLSPFEIMDRTLEEIVRNNDIKFKIDRLDKQIENVKSSWASGDPELISGFLEQLQKERYELFEKIKTDENK